MASELELERMSENIKTFKQWWDNILIKNPDIFPPSNKLEPGFLVYKYLPKTPEIVYDTYPLLFLIKRKKKYWEGINFHFIEHKSIRIDFAKLWLARKRIIIPKNFARHSVYRRYKYDRMLSQFYKLSNKWVKDAIEKNRYPFRIS